MNPKKSSFREEDGCLVRIIHYDKVKAAREKAIPSEDVERLESTFKVLGDSTRLKLIIALRQGEMCVCDLAALLGISESAVSHQLRRLKDLAMVKSRRDGQILYYSLDDRHVEDLIRLGIEHIRE